MAHDLNVTASNRLLKIHVRSWRRSDAEAFEGDLVSRYRKREGKLLLPQLFLEVLWNPQCPGELPALVLRHIRYR